MLTSSVLCDISASGTCFMNSVFFADMKTSAKPKNFDSVFGVLDRFAVGGVTAWCGKSAMLQSAHAVGCVHVLGLRHDTGIS